MTLFFIIHIIVAGVILFFHPIKRSPLSYLLSFFLIFFPIVGPLTFLYVTHGKNHVGKEEIATEHFDWIEEAKHEKISQKKQVLQLQNVVPLQEALLLNNKAIRRELIIDAVLVNPDRFVPLLKEARLNDDVEVVHYATTILSELSTKYETQLDELEMKVSENPNNLNFQKAYLDFLYDYLMSDLLEGHLSDVLKSRYMTIMQNLIGKNQIKDIEDYQRLAMLYLETNKLDKLSQLIDVMGEQFPDEEATLMVRLEWIIAKKSATELQQFFSDLKKSRVYFSKANREKIAFWQAGVY